MLVICSEGTPYLTLGAKVSKGFDQMIPKEGVETYAESFRVFRRLR